MLFAIDIGNTNMVIGCIDKEKILFSERLSTDHSKTALEYALCFKNILELHDLSSKDIDGAIIASVVPPLTSLMTEALGKISGCRVRTVGPGLKNGLKIHMDDPAQIGADLIVGAVAGIHDYTCPLILIDIPHLDQYECDEDRIKYIRAQFDDAIRQLEEITGKKMDYDKLKSVMEVSQRSSQAWLRAVGYMSAEPSPFSGFDIFNNMAVACVGRGTVEAAEAFEQLADEYEALVAEGKSTFKGDENYRILFEGIACWANLRFTYKTLQSRGINLTASVYGPAFSFLYSNLDELMAAYSYVPNSNCFERELELRVVDAKKNKVDGAIFHMNRSCKHWSGNLYEMERQFREQTGVPTIVFDGDQSDPRAFSEAQYETRVEALVEIMEENKRKEAQA